jgi:hypothetical protein
VKALCEWFKRYGPVHLWVTDQGAHFKNRAVDWMQKAWGAEHHFVTAYCPWANGSVEVVNRVLLKVLKSMLSKRKYKTVEWTKVVAWVQASLNFSPSSRLGTCAAITAFLGLPAPSPVKKPFVEYLVEDLPTVDNVSWSKEVCRISSSYKNQWNPCTRTWCRRPRGKTNGSDSGNKVSLFCRI